MAQAVSCRPPTVEAWVQSRVSPCGMWWTKWHWDRFLPEFFGFPCQYHSTGAALLGEGKGQGKQLFV
jgi:hypothetical protein